MKQIELNDYSQSNYDPMYSDRPYPPNSDNMNQQYQYPSNQQYQYPSNQQYILNGGMDQSGMSQPYQNDLIVVPPSKDDGPLAHLDDSLAGWARKSFIMKVYMILSLQLLITTGMCFLSYYNFYFFVFQINNQWLMWVSFVVLIITEITIFCCPAGRKHPINIILLLIFTLCESYSISYLCAFIAI